MNSTVKSFSIVTGFSVVTRLLSFLFKIWMSRSLGAETVGIYQISLSILLLLFSLTAGAPTVLSRKVAEAGETGNIKKQNALTTASILIGLGTALALCAIFYACSNHLGVLFADDRCVPIFLIMLPALVTSTLYASIRSWFWGRKNFLAFSSTELIDEGVKFVLSVIFAGGLISALTGAKGVAMAFVLSDLICVLILAALYFKAGGRLAKPEGAKGIIKSTVPLSTVRILTSLTASMTALVIPQRLVASGMTTALATAAYGRVAGMAFPLIMAPVTVISALSVVLIPDMAALAAKGDFEAIKGKMQTSLLFAAIIAAMFFSLYVPLGQHLGSFFFGDSEAGIYVSYAAVIIFPLALNQVTTPILNSLGMEKHTFLSYIAGAVCMLPCIFFLPKHIGIYAMAVGSGVAFIVTSIINYVILVKKLGRPSGMGKVLATALFSLPLAALGFLTNNLVAPYIGDAVALIVLGVYICFFFFIFVSAFGIVDIKGFFLMANFPHKKKK